MEATTDLDQRLDLSGVLPARRDLVRARILAIEAYEALDVRTQGDARRIADSVGISIPTLYRLRRAWLRDRDPIAMQGGTGPRRVTRSMGDEPAVLEILRELPETGSIESRVLAIERKAADRGMAIRSRSALRRLVRKNIDPETSHDPHEWGPRTIALDMVPIDLPVQGSEGPTLPTLAVIMRAATGRILHAGISLESPSLALATRTLCRWIFDSKRNGDPGDGGPRADRLLLVGTPRLDWSEGTRSLATLGIRCVEVPGGTIPAGSLIRRLHGQTVLGMRMHPRMANREETDRRPARGGSRLNAAIGIDDAISVIRERMSAQTDA